MSWRRALALVLGLAGGSGSGMASAEEGRVRMRAREHYESLVVSHDGRSARYWGFTNTIVLHYEVPYRYAVGVAGSPLFATLRREGPLPGFSERIRLVHLGIEGKLFPVDEVAAFVRAEGYTTTLNPRGDAGIQRGESALLGLGYEFDLDGIGLAPEFAWRWGLLGDGTRFTGAASAVGLHFYRAF